ncbi:histidine phosphatase family protein [Nocardioides conyzicola]|uniref:Histidine phosphatase family protein n=1 Tax=Nocardioides conyzicola TaxID=1651781 RepID=A0ABP8Y294_9ACTN
MVLPRWTDGPQTIVLVRHGESVGNLADTAAREARAEHLDLDQRDADVELSPTGREQADAVAAWVSGLAESDLPTTVLSSPYRRAAETAERAMRDRGIEVAYDERLRERDLGIFDGLTGYGIRAQHPDEAARRKKLGKFYYQPPSGESWADVVLRVRSLLTDLRHGYDRERIWMFTHQAVIMSFRYALEGLDEQSLLAIDREVQIPNASFTRFHRDADVLELDVFADTAAVDAAGTERTAEASPTGSGDVHA